MRKIILLSVFVLIFILKLGSASIKSPFIKTKEEPLVKAKYKKLKASYYNPQQGQTDSTPFVTASCLTIDTVKLKLNKLRWVALSRDQLTRWGGKFDYGDTIVIKSANKLLNGKWVVQDCLNSRFKNKIDFLCWKNIPGRLNDVSILLPK